MVNQLPQGWKEVPFNSILMCVIRVKKNKAIRIST